MKTVAIAIMTMVLLLAAGYLLGAVLGLVFGLVSTAATKLLYLWNDDKFAPQRRGGRRVQEHEAPELVATLRDLARRAGIPVPNLYVIESPTKANALAAGRGRRHAAICVTTGLLHALSRDELAGVLAHELGHVLRRSAVIKTTAAVLGAAVSLLPPFGIFFGLGIGISLLLMFVIATRCRSIAIGDRPCRRICCRRIRRPPHWPTRRGRGLAGQNRARGRRGFRRYGEQRHGANDARDRETDSRTAARQSVLSLPFAGKPRG